MTKEQEIQKHMQVLGLTREQAEQLWEDDNSDFVSEEMAEMERKAKANRRYEQSDKPRAKAKRELKIDEDKVKIINNSNFEKYNYKNIAKLIRNEKLINS